MSYFLNLLQNFGEEPDEVLRILKPIYDLPDVVDYWYLRFSVFLREELVMTNIDSGFSLYFDGHNRRIKLLGIFVDDILVKENEEFNEYSAKITSKFDCKEQNSGYLYFAGVHIVQHADGSITLHQEAHAKRIKPMSRSATFDEFRSSYRAIT